MIFIKKSFNTRTFFLITGILFLVFIFFINHFTYSFTNNNFTEEYFEIIISDQLSLAKNIFNKEYIFLNLDPLSIIVLSNKEYPSASFF